MAAKNSDEGMPLLRHSAVRNIPKFDRALRSFVNVTGSQIDAMSMPNELANAKCLLYCCAGVSLSDDCRVSNRPAC